jgi:poly(hydroxyalkanoate) depolymerase family esterase
VVDPLAPPVSALMLQCNICICALQQWPAYPPQLITTWSGTIKPFARLEGQLAYATALRTKRIDASGPRLRPFAGFGANPGGLDAKIHVPSSVEKRAPLVVVLHGCTQTAEAYARGAGWIRAADDHGFVLLLPEQKRANNPNLCFNWFSPRDARRGRGEALSIAQMVKAVQDVQGTDLSRVFVTGLSAGGAMAAVMLTTYPEIFAGGAIVAGLPFGIANNVPQALERMRGHDIPEAERLGELARSASNYPGPWPSLSVWHGTNDTTVDRKNARAVVDQWRELHGAARKPCKADVVHGHRHYVWCDGAGRQVIEEYQVRGLGHGTPLSTRELHSAEVVGPHMLEAGISSTRQILRFWGLAAGGPNTSTAVDAAPEFDQHHPTAVPDAITSTIEQALRAAGLLR